MGFRRVDQDLEIAVWIAAKDSAHTGKPPAHFVTRLLPLEPPKIRILEYAKRQLAGPLSCNLVLTHLERWRSGRPLTRLRCLSNLTLCLQKRRSSADLIHVADGAVKEIRALQERSKMRPRLAL